MKSPLKQQEPGWPTKPTPVMGILLADARVLTKQTRHSRTTLLVVMSFSWWKVKTREQAF